MTEELKPCPFCGADEADYTGSPGKGYRVECQACLAQSGWGDYGTQVAAKWNKRQAGVPTQREPDEIDYDDPRFNQGVQHVVDMLSRTIGAEGWVAGDGSEDYDSDLEQTLLNILAARGLYDKDEGEYAVLPVRHAETTRACEGEKDTIVQLIHKHVGIRDLFEGAQELTGVDQAADVILDALKCRSPAVSNRETIAETIWSAELRRAMGKERSIPWSEVAEPDKNKYRFLADAILARLSQPAKGGWRSIDTAPHEERVLLGWWDDGFWNTDVGLASHGWRRNGVSTMSYHGQATHWAPLVMPSPPLPSTEGRDAS